jgi:4-diphosphocytidyl-2-C-methyl-D-erythritol kinase
MMKLEGNAPAKINLTLEVLGRRADGYHEIASVMHTLDLHDTLALELPDAPALDVGRGNIEILPGFLAPLGMTKTFSESKACHSERSEESPHAHIPTDSRNLIWKAVEVFVKNCPHPQPLSVNGEGSRNSPSPTAWEKGKGAAGWRATLIKRIPTQAGLGGGSSNAATALELLAKWARLWDIPTPNLHALAAQLGADVAFFLNGACALAQGKGEKLTPLPPLPPFWWVIAKPYGVGVPTGWAYELLKRGELKPHARAFHTEHLVDALKRGGIKTPHYLAPLLHNDFDEPILNAIPELRTLREQMKQSGVLKVILCGSGAAQAALCVSQEQAESLAKSLIQQGYWAVAAQNA